jgi:YD repeat-containing protein
MHKLFLLLTLSLPLFAVKINRLNGALGIYYIDISLVESPFVLELVRSYNSLTALNEKSGWEGSFGWGWSSPIETTLTLTPERNIIVRDGSSGNSILFKAENEDPKSLDKFFEEFKKAYGGKENIKAPAKLIEKMKTDAKYRLQMAKKYMKEQNPKSGMLVSKDLGYQTMRYIDGSWVREYDGIRQVFDKDGRLKEITDRQGYKFVFAYDVAQKYQVKKITAVNKNAGLEFIWKNNKVVQVKDFRGKVSEYKYSDNGNLIESMDSNKQIYRYEYENKRFPHLLTKVLYPQESKGNQKVYRELRYDNNGLVVFHKDKDNSETQYIYGKSSTDPENSLTTRSIRKLGSMIEEQFDEFTVKTRSDGTKYLFKLDSKVGNVLSSTTYTECCSKPLLTKANGLQTNYKYNPEGQLVEKTNSKESIKIDYHPRFKKVARIKVNDKVSEFEYDTKGQLISAKNFNKQKVSLKYNAKGQIQEMVSSNGRQLVLQYSATGKPTMITEKQTGSVKVEYNAAGQIERTLTQVNPNSKKKGPQDVLMGILSDFNEMLSLIRTASLAYTDSLATGL